MIKNDHNERYKYLKIRCYNGGFSTFGQMGEPKPRVTCNQKSRVQIPRRVFFNNNSNANIVLKTLKIHMVYSKWTKPVLNRIFRKKLFTNYIYFPHLKKTITKQKPCYTNFSNISEINYNKHVIW